MQSKNMNTLQNNNRSQGHEDRLIRQKRRYGIAYGVVVGLAFTVAVWGWDGYMLSQAHGFLPWTKFTLGGSACALAGGLAGWVTSRLERWLFTLSAWLAAGFFFAWLIVSVPLQIAPQVSVWFEPQLAQALELGGAEHLPMRVAADSLWTVPFILLAGGFQNLLVESAIFAANSVGNVAPFLAGALIVSICGTVADNFNNEPLRSAMLAMDRTVQFVLDSRDVNADPAASRKNHAGSLRGIKDQITQDRAMTITGYSSDLGEVRIAIQFETLLADCTVIYNQPIICKPAQGSD
ncbi:MAG: hypothetical protein AMXMBFR60_32890 [Chloroflexota bacterium]